ncbi:response regulator [Sphingomonas hylomeconis]|uniref:Response regulator n=1 Tax=Sphingomonas hylomeconis TaxID=1395958 RepID=A0ABV7SRS7_9SPHN|nr:response regulator [Sphingomonas hylomeconis]
MVVEDEPSVLLFLEEGLDERGFDVISARNGGEALHILGSNPLDVAVLVADIRIGEGIDGWEIARCARDIEPALPIVYITGDSAGAWDEQGVPNSRLLQKPFTRLDLADAINGLLETA